MADFYQALGVARNATEAEIKAAYRKLALKYHPDRNPGDKGAETRFKEASEAYQVISDPQKRQAYDQYGEAGVRGAGGGPGGPGGFEGMDPQDIFGDIFSNFFGEGGGRGGPRRGSDLKYETTVTLDDAYGGTVVEVEYPRIVPCGKCGGSGAKAGTGLKKCGTCHGSGRVQFAQGFFSMTQACSHCGGAGRMVETPCPGCRGAGRLRENTKRSVRIPAGVEDGTTLRLQGAGEAGGHGAQAGDLFIVVRVKTHTHFERVEDDLLYERRITFPQAALGCDAEVPTISGEKATIRIPEGVQDGTTLRLRDKGMPHLHGRGHGDMLVKIRVEVPRHLNGDQKRLLEEFARSLETEDGKPHPQAKDRLKDEGGFFKKIFKGKDE